MNRAFIQEIASFPDGFTEMEFSLQFPRQILYVKSDWRLYLELSFLRKLCNKPYIVLYLHYVASYRILKLPGWQGSLQVLGCEIGLIKKYGLH